MAIQQVNERRYYERRMGEDQVHDQRSLGDLFSDLSSDISTLLQQEVQLAKVELSQKATKAGREMAMVAMGGAIIYAGLLALVAAVINMLALFMPEWVAALLTGVVVAGIGYMIFRQGMQSLKKMDPVPRETMETLKEDKEWINRQMK